MTDKEMLNAVTRTLAKADLPSGSAEKLAAMVSKLGHRPIGVDICKYGICLDMLVDGGLDKLDLRKVEEVAVGRIRDIEIFPWGIIRPDLLRVRIAQEF